MIDKDGVTPDRALADEAVDDATQALFTATAAPLARTAELLAAIKGAGVRSALEARIAQILTHGHTADVDDMLPVGWLPMEARHALDQARNELERKPKDRDLGKVRAGIVEAVAFGLAAIDRIDRGRAWGER